jgi:hypothetical protein
MPTNGDCVKPSLREILANSHIPAVAIAVLLLWSLNWGFQALWSPLLRVGDFLFIAVAILKIPYFSPTLTGADLFMLTTTLLFLFNALISFAAAWLLARWVYGVGPLRSLSKYRTRLARRNHV